MTTKEVTELLEVFWSKLDKIHSATYYQDMLVVQSEIGDLLMEIATKRREILDAPKKGRRVKRTETPPPYVAPIDTEFPDNGGSEHLMY